MQELRYESVDEVYEVLRKRKERTAIFAQEKNTSPRKARWKRSNAEEKGERGCGISLVVKIKGEHWQV